MTVVFVVAIIIGVPALTFALWPLVSPRRAGPGVLALPHDVGEQGLERKVARARRWWRRPIGVATGAVTLVAFGVVSGVGVARYTTRDTRAALAVAAKPDGPTTGAGREQPQAEGGRAVTPQMLQGMLQAARISLFAGRYDEAITAYQAVLRRDPENVDALAHFGLIVGMGGDVDQALQVIDRVLARDPNYPPALLYRGQILYEAKKDTVGAVQAWTRLVTLLPPGEDRERVTKMIADAKAGTMPRP